MGIVPNDVNKLNCFLAKVIIPSEQLLEGIGHILVMFMVNSQLGVKRSFHCGSVEEEFFLNLRWQIG